MRLVLAMLLVPSLALAAEEKPAAGSGDPMAQWTPPKVKNEAKDKQEIQAVFKAMDAASRTGDLEAGAALIDFPVTMITDDKKGQASGDAWSREQWTQVMKPFYDKPMKDAKVTHKPTIFLLSDSLASVTDVYTMTQGGKSITARTAMLLARIDGKWRVKAMVEGGWGDAMARGARRRGRRAAPARRPQRTRARATSRRRRSRRRRRPRSRASRSAPSPWPSPLALPGGEGSHESSARGSERERAQRDPTMSARSAAPSGASSSFTRSLSTSATMISPTSSTTDRKSPSFCIPAACFWLSSVGVT
jgi:uncharacterized protein (TIGR02246 family)